MILTEGNTTQQAMDTIVKDTVDRILAMVETEMDEGDWINSVYQLTTRMGATPQEHAEVMGLADTLIAAALSKALMERITQRATEEIA